MNNIRRFLLNHVLFVLTAVIFFTSCSNPRYINSPAVHNAAFLKNREILNFLWQELVTPQKYSARLMTMIREKHWIIHWVLTDRLP